MAARFPFKLFAKIYYKNVTPEQWKMAKITPDLQKGLLNEIDQFLTLAQTQKSLKN